MDCHRILSRLPSVDSVLFQADVQSLLQRYCRPQVIAGIRKVLEQKRAELLQTERETQGGGEEPSVEEKALVSAAEVLAAIQDWMAPPLLPVINATGVVLHTNLGRAPLAREAIERLLEVAACYSNLELDLGSGERGSRMNAVRDILVELSGVEDALVVNNNAAAVYLILRAQARGREVIVSRGELVEIGGSFRIPDVMEASGALLVEVGTTNKTRVADYEKAIGPQTALLMKIHRSNFALVGFSEEASLEELCALGGQKGVPVVMDLGSGCLLDNLLGEKDSEPTVRQVSAAGVDLLCFSGDKMLGGPQAGIILGKSAHVQALARDPMTRALRVDKLTLAALYGTLSLYRCGEAEVIRQLPVVSMLRCEPEALTERANQLLRRIQEGSSGIEAQVVATVNRVGGGAMPLLELPGAGVALSPQGETDEQLAARLRRGRPPVLARRLQGKVILDVRTVLDAEQLDQLAGAVRGVWGTAHV